MNLVITLVVVNIVLTCVTVGLLIAVIMKVSSKKSCEERKNYVGQRIVGGKLMPIKSFPFMAAIVVKKHGIVGKDSLQCGSTIVSTNWVLSAAHCITLLIEQEFDKNVVYISSGSASWIEGKKHDILHWVYHDRFDQSIMNDDIALIAVKQPFQGALHRPIPIASKNYHYKANVKITVIGWGLHQSGETEVQRHLNGVDVIIFNQTYCKNLYALQGQEVTSTMFCAGAAAGGKDACQFDSGGPIFHNNLLIGIVSWGVDCGKKNQPGVYTRVNLYRDWIISTTNKFKMPIVATFKDNP